MCVRRPSWSRCAEHIAGGEEQWKKATEGKTSDQIVDVLLAEIQGAADSRESGRADYFEGLVSIQITYSVISLVSIRLYFATFASLCPLEKTISTKLPHINA